jgi:hypothetical protein
LIVVFVAFEKLLSAEDVKMSGHYDIVVGSRNIPTIVLLTFDTNARSASDARIPQRAIRLSFLMHSSNKSEKPLL